MWYGIGYAENPIFNITHYDTVDGKFAKTKMVTLSYKGKKYIALDVMGELSDYYTCSLSDDTVSSWLYVTDDYSRPQEYGIKLSSDDVSDVSEITSFRELHQG